MLGDATVQLVDTYDPLEARGTRPKLGPPLWGVRLDSGDFLALSRAGARASWTRPGCTDAQIMAQRRPGRIPHPRICWRAGAPVDSFGVGTQLATSADAPTMSATYKLVELDISGIKRFTAKYSEDKTSFPAPSRFSATRHRDVIARSGECGRGEALLRPVILGGQLVEPLPSLEQARAARRGIRRAASRPRCDNSKWPNRGR